jgi:hypothetical protein
MCAAVDIPNVQFIVCGGGPDLETLKSQVHEKGMADRFIITGQVSQDELLNYYARMDVFGYPLYEKHIGTCEQVIGEAMAAGVVPVVLDNEPEKKIITNLEDGLITQKEHYSKDLKMLYDDELLYDNMYQCSIQTAKNKYDTWRMIPAWQQEFTELMQIDKSKKSWYGNNVGSYLFKESLGKHAKPFENDDRLGIVELLRHTRQWASESKGSIKQYAKCYPEDEKLKEWESILGEIK